MQVKATTANRQMLLLWLFLCLYCAVVSNLSACDADSFVFEEFGVRCQRLSEYIKDLQIARKMDMAVANDKRQKLLNEWVAFYLDHGQSPPASFTMMTDQNWQRTLVRAGETIGQFAYGKIPAEEAETACIPFDLLSQQPKLETTMALLASWSEKIAEPAGENASQTSAWLFINLGYFIELNRTIGTGYPVELQNSKKLVAYFNQQWRFVVEAPESSAAAVYRFTRDELVGRLRKEYERWRQLAFM